LFRGGAAAHSNGRVRGCVAAKYRAGSPARAGYRCDVGGLVEVAAPAGKFPAKCEHPRPALAGGWL